jgi:hypothetical protein
MRAKNLSLKIFDKFFQQFVCPLIKHLNYQHPPATFEHFEAKFTMGNSPHYYETSGVFFDYLLSPSYKTVCFIKIKE